LRSANGFWFHTFPFPNRHFFTFNVKSSTIFYYIQQHSRNKSKKNGYSSYKRITPSKTPPVDNEVDIDDRLNNLWKEICGCLMAYCDDVDNHGFWSDGDQILCPTKIHADIVADFLEALGFGCLNSGYYDPAEDELNGEVDEYTGYWYVQ